MHSCLRLAFCYTLSYLLYFVILYRISFSNEVALSLFGTIMMDLTYILCSSDKVYPLSESLYKFAEARFKRV